jgi:hypothetical protein
LFHYTPKLLIQNTFHSSYCGPFLVVLHSYSHIHYFYVSCLRWCQICVICNQSHGSCTSCCKCATYFHVMCASRMGYGMEVSVMVVLLKFKLVLDLKLLLFLLNFLFSLEDSKVIYVYNKYIDFYES